MKTSSFAGKVAAVTGAGSGIGRALAMALAQRDCFVAASDVNLEALSATPSAPSAAASRSWTSPTRPALRIECEMTRAPVSATCVHPGGIRTNIMNTTRLHESLAVFGVEPQMLVRNFSKYMRMSPDKAAAIILRAVQRNARRVLVGADAHALDLMHRLVPGRYHAVMALVARHMMGARAADRA